MTLSFETDTIERKGTSNLQARMAGEEGQAVTAALKRSYDKSEALSVSLPNKKDATSLAGLIRAIAVRDGLGLSGPHVEEVQLGKGKVAFKVKFRAQPKRNRNV